MCICLPVIRCISCLSFYLMIGSYSEGQHVWSVMILLSGDLKVGGETGGWKKKKLPSFCGFEQPLICTKFRFALLFFWDQSLTRKYYSIITGMLNQQNAIVKVLTGGFSPPRERERARDGSFPSHAICATVHIKSTWNFMLLGLHVLCGSSACVCVCGGLFLSHTLACKTMHAQKHTLSVSSISAVKPDPPRLFSLVIMSKFAQEGRGKGSAMWTCVGVFCFSFLCVSVFFFLFFSFFCLKNWLPPISDTRDPNHPLKPLQNERRGSKNISSALPPSFFFSLSLSLLCWKLNLAPGARRRRRRVFTCYQVTTSV